MWCKPGQYLDHKNCVCKNKLAGRLISECTSVINEAMVNNKDSGNNNTLWNVFVGLFSVVILIGVICFLCLFILNALKIKNYLKINMLIINYKVDIEPLQIKNKYYYDCDDIKIYDLDFDIGLVKIFKRESKIGVNIYYIGYKQDIDDTITPLFFFVDHLFGFIEEIKGSSDR